MKYFSLCSGIEAATVAWHKLGWSPVGFAEIAPFPAHVLHRRYNSGRPAFMPDPAAPGLTEKQSAQRAAAIRQVAGLPEKSDGVPNFGDLNRYKEWPDAKFDLLVGGTPCQAFSVAGLRKGLADPRGNLSLTYLAILERYKPRWCIWENVPGVITSWTGDEPPGDLLEGQERQVEQTSDFGCFLGGLAELGYGFAYRVVDAQYVRVDQFERALPHQRRRVFVVGHCNDDWRAAAAVLFERESLSWNSPPRRSETEAGPVARPAEGGAGDSGRRNGMDRNGLDAGPASDQLRDEVRLGEATGSASARFLGVMPGVSPTLKARDYKGVSSDGHDDGAPLVVDAFNTGGRTGLGRPAVEAAVARSAASTLSSAHKKLVRCVLRAFEHWVVRRLTPVEFERLLGFPDDYTSVRFGRGLATDRWRYEALGNSMAVNVMMWIGSRIDMVDRLVERESAGLRRRSPRPSSGRSKRSAGSRPAGDAEGRGPRPGRRSAKG